MTLDNLLTTLDGKNVLVTVSDVDNEIIRFYAGTTALDDALLARTVRKWSVTGATAVSIILNAE